MGVIMGDKMMADNWKILLTAPGFIPLIQIPFLIYFNIESPYWLLEKHAEKINKNINATLNEEDNIIIAKVTNDLVIEKYVKRDTNDNKPTNAVETNYMNISDDGRQLDIDVVFEEKYKFKIAEEHLNRMKKDLNKIYTPESADFSFEQLCLEHKEKLSTEPITMKEVISNKSYRYLFFIAIMQNIFTRLTGANFFQFYCVYSFDNLGLQGNWALFGLVFAAL